MRDEEIGVIQSNLILALLFAAICSRRLSTNQRRDKLSRIQKVRSIGSDRKSTEQMSCQSERASELHYYCDKWWEFLHHDKRHAEFM